MAKEETILDLPEYKEPKLSVSDHVNGVGMSFEVDGRTFYLRPPTPEEVNDVELDASIAAKRVAVKPEMRELAQEPAPVDEIEALKAVAALQHKALVAESENKELEQYWDDRIEALYRMLERRTAATSIIDEHESRIRNTSMAEKILQDEDRHDVDFHSLHPRVRTVVLKHVSDYLTEINLLPFG